MGIVGRIGCRSWSGDGGEGELSIRGVDAFSLGKSSQDPRRLHGGIQRTHTTFLTPIVCL